MEGPRVIHARFTYGIEQIDEVLSAYAELWRCGCAVTVGTHALRAERALRQEEEMRSPPRRDPNSAPNLWMGSDPNPLEGSGVEPMRIGFEGPRIGL